MAEVKWIKIVTDIFDDEKILLIESMPEADSVIVIWFKLLCLAGKNNNSGVFMLNEKIPYTDEMLSTIFRRSLNTVRLALKTFEQFGMIAIIDNAITIPNWSKHQTLDQLEEKKEYMREYMQGYRERQKLLASGKANSKTNSKANVSSIDKEEEREEDIDIEEDKIRVDWNSILIAWNSLPNPIKPIKVITSRRKDKIRARINSLNIKKEDIIQAIENIRKSSFCQGKNRKGWIMDFDWLFKDDTRFTKVLEGKYTDKEGRNGGTEQDNEKGKGKYTGFKPAAPKVTEDVPPDLI